MGCRTRIVYHERYGRRGFTALRRTWNRYGLFLGTLPASPLKSLVPLLEAPAASENDILQAHTPDYVDYIQNLDLTGVGRLDGSTPAWRGMYARAERVGGGSLLGADLIASGYARHVFNPAGGQHHAHAGRGGGFCVFNDVVCAVRRLQCHGFKRVAVVDLDGHHGDGTASLLAEEPILAISAHQFGGRTYPGTGAAHEVGEGAGTGFSLNLPLAAGTGDRAYREILTRAVEPLLRAYAPDVVVVEFGTDGHAADPLLKLRLSTAMYRWMASWLHRLAHELCEGRLLILGGGGYEPEHVVRCWMIMLAEMCGLPLQRVHPEAGDWLAEPPMPAVTGSDDASLLAAEEARQMLFPLHGLA